MQNTTLKVLNKDREVLAAEKGNNITLNYDKEYPTGGEERTLSSSLIFVIG